MIMMTKLSYSGLKYGKSDVEIKLMADIQNDWIEITHTKEASQVINKSTGEYIIVNRNTLKCVVVS
jgi:flagellar basal body P-ring protein FlgI